MAPLQTDESEASESACVESGQALRAQFYTSWKSRLELVSALLTPKVGINSPILYPEVAGRLLIYRLLLWVIRFLKNINNLIIGNSHIKIGILPSS